MAEKQILSLKPTPRLEQIADEHSKRVQDRKHRSQECDDSALRCESSRMEFSERTGRPQGAKGEDTIFRAVVNTKVPMSLRGRVRQVPLLEAVWMRIADDALKGNAKAATLLINRSRSLDAAAPTNPELDQDDQQVLQSYYRQVEAELKAMKEKS